MERKIETLINAPCNYTAMANKHIKTINGRRYYYKSVRIGKKVTSKYLRPVDKKIKRKKQKLQETVLSDISYIG
jgi:hypothetical protein